MLFPIEQLIEDRGKPLCVSQDTKLSDALALMVEHDYSQIPVVNENGHLAGMVSENSIINTYYHSEGVVNFLDLPVHHFQRSATTITSGSDIFEALDLLKRVYAIVVVQDRAPIGILTNYDTTHFFRDLSEGLIFIQDIEMTLRQVIDDAFDTEDEMKAALTRAFDVDKRNPQQPARRYDELSFSQHVQLIVTEENWGKFKGIFGPKALFKSLMDRVGSIRNQLAHFRGQLEPTQRQALIDAKEWIESRPKIVQKESPKDRLVQREELSSREEVGKYAPLEQLLKQERGQRNRLPLSFQEIEGILADDLPPSAREHRSWWSNDPWSHTQALAWLRSGWRVDDVDLAGEKVVFQQTNSVLMQVFFADLLKRLKKARPGLTRATKTFPQNWWSFGAGKSGFSFAWVFTGEDKLRVEVYIDTGDRKRNKKAFSILSQQKDEIESEIGVALDWQRLDEKQASRIALARPGTITDPPEKLEENKQWALERMLDFVDTFQPRIKELRLD